MRLNYVLLLAFAIALLSLPYARAAGIIGVGDSSVIGQILVGNLSQSYNLTVNVTTNESQYLRFNVTFILPYGVENTSICNAVVITTSQYRCIIVYAPANGSNVLQSNLSFTANHSAYPAYGNQSFNFTVDGENATTNSTLKSVRGINFWRNPRPHLSAGQVGNVRFQFEKWNQTDATYRVMVPIWTYNASAGRPQLAGASYGEVMYFDKSFFEEPSYMRIWSYNLSFRIYLDQAQNVSFNMIAVINSSNNSAQSAEGLLPLESMTFESLSFTSNATRNFTIGVPNSFRFDVYVNGTRTNNTGAATKYGINLTYSGGDPTVRLFDINVSTMNLSLINGTEINVLLTVVNVTGCQSGPAETGRCGMSPIYVTTQQSNGLSFDEPPKFGQSLNISFLVNVTNRFSNYTVQDLRLSFMQPMNVTMNRNGTARRFNMTLPNQVKMLTWNSSASWIENMSMTRTDSTVQFNDTHGPTQGAVVNISISTFDITISANTATFQNWDPGTGGSGYAYVNFTAEMAFPTIDESALPNGSAGLNHSYNVTANNPVRSSLNLTDKLPGLNSSARNVNITINGIQLANGSNYTIGSLVINDVSAGSAVISVSYEVPTPVSSGSSSTTSSSSSSSGGGGGTAPETDKKVHSWTNVVPGTEYFMNVSSGKIPVSEIHYEVLQKIESVQMVVQSLSARPAEITIEPSGKVFQYVNITSASLVQSNLRSSKIRFMVSKAWLDENGFDPSDVQLKRFAGTTWQPLETALIAPSGADYEFEAVTPGFSTFAITAEETIVEEIVEEITPPAEEPAAELPPPPPAPQMPEVSEEGPGMDMTSMLVVILALAVVAILGYIHYHHKPVKKS